MRPFIANILSNLRFSYGDVGNRLKYLFSHFIFIVLVQELSVFPSSLCNNSQNMEETAPEALFFTVTLDDLTSNRTAYKLDKDCSICSASLSRGLSVLGGKKHHCHFCYRGVCAKCSGHKVNHPETMREKRCCNACYIKFLSVSIQKETIEEITRIKQESGEIESRLQEEVSERENEDRRKRDLEAEVTRLKQELMRNESNFLAQKAALDKELAEAAASNSRLMETIETLDLHLETAKQELTQAETDLKAVTFELANCNVKANELKSLLLTQEHENEGLKRTLDAKPQSNLQGESTKKKGKIEELKQMVGTMNQREVVLQQEEMQLRQRLEEGLARLQEVGSGRGLERVSTGVSETDVRRLVAATELKEKIKELREENDRLKAALSP